jgi:hypothetical protein
MKIYKINFIIPAQLLTYFPSFSQGIQIRGKVFDNFDETLPSVNVVVRRTMISILSDEKGEFSLIAPSDTCTLIFFTEYKTE